MTQQLVLPRRTWTGSPNYSSRGGQRTRLVVVHDCEGSYAGSVSWFARTDSVVSAHVVLSEDGQRAAQMVNFANKAWHACSFNPLSEGIEAAGFAAKGLGDPEWRALAALVAWRLRENGLPCQYATGANAWTGYCQHVDLGAAGGGHHDVTLDPVVRSHFSGLVEAAYAMGMPEAWVGGGAIPAPAPPPDWQPSPEPRHDLVYGSVEWVQACLNSLHVTHTPLTVDGMVGPATEHAIVVFQSTHRPLYVDGVPGPHTIAAIKEEVKL